MGQALVTCPAREHLLCAPARDRGPGRGSPVRQRSQRYSAWPWAGSAGGRASRLPLPTRCSRTWRFGRAALRRSARLRRLPGKRVQRETISGVSRHLGSPPSAGTRCLGRKYDSAWDQPSRRLCWPKQSPGTRQRETVLQRALTPAASDAATCTTARGDRGRVMPAAQFAVAQLCAIPALQLTKEKIAEICLVLG